MCKNTTRPLCSTEDEEYQKLQKRAARGPVRNHGHCAAFKQDGIDDFCAGP